MPVCPYRSLLADMDSQLSEHEIMMLGRIYSVREQPELDVGLMLAIAQEHLKKKQFESFSDMLRAFTHEDRDRYNRSYVTHICILHPQPGDGAWPLVNSQFVMNSVLIHASLKLDHKLYFFTPHHE